MSESTSTPGSTRADLAHPVDHSLKILVTRTPEVFLRLNGTTIAPACFQRDNTAINIPGMAADFVHLVREPQKEPWIYYQEFALRPDPGDIGDWELKKSALRKIHQKKVLLLVVYLEKGSYATFPDRLVETAGGLTNQFEFDTIRLWEHKDLIASGEEPHLLPLRLLCEENPDQGTLEEIREGIKSSELPVEEQRELLAVTVLLGSRLFTREVLKAMLREEAIPVKELPLIGEWVTEAEAQGEAREARQMALVVLRERFGDIPQSIVDRVDSADRQWCEDLVRRTLKAPSLQELDLA